MSRRSSPRLVVLLVIAAAIVLAGILLTSFVYYRGQKEALRQEVWTDLDTIADLKVRQIAEWRKWRMTEARFLSHLPSLTQDAGALSEGGPNAAPHLTRLLALYRKHTQPDAIGIFRSDCTPIWSDPPGMNQLSAVPCTAGRLGLDRQTIQFTDPYLDETGKLFLDLLVPVVGHGHADAVPVLLVLRLNPRQYLYPLVESWPTDARTAETLLVRRLDSKVVFLNELKHRKGTAARFVLPLDRPQLPAARAVQGIEGTFEGLDYRGVPVLAVTRTIPDSPWSMVSKMDQVEAYAPISQMGKATAFQLALLLATIGFGSGLVITSLRTRYLARQHQNELERQTLEKRFDYLSKYANDVILLLNRDLIVVEGNDRALEVYGYAREELTGLPFLSLRAPAERGSLSEELQVLNATKGLRVETTHVRKDGSTFPAESSIRLIDIDNERFYQAIIRNISERRKAEDMLRTAHAELEIRVQERTDELRRLADYLEKVREDEAKRISVEIHDQLGAGLTAARFRLSSLRKTVEGATLASLDSTIQLVDQVLKDVRRISRGLRPSVLDHLGLSAAIEVLLEDFQSHTGIKCSLAINIPEISDPSWSIAVYRIFQEALTNIARHSGASLIQASLAVQDGRLVLEIADNGKGFKVEDVQQESRGLLGMRERAHRLGGNLEVLPVEPTGTRIRAWIPLTNTVPASDATA